jgi:hypothetical protein
VCACAPFGSSRCPRRVAGSLVSLAAVGKNIASRFIGRPLDAVLRCASEISFFPLFFTGSAACGAPHVAQDAKHHKKYCCPFLDASAGRGDKSGASRDV